VLLRYYSFQPLSALDSVALSLTVGWQGTTGAHRGRPGGLSRSGRRNHRGSVDYVALAAAGMSVSRGSTSGSLLSSFASRQSSADKDSQVEAPPPQSLFDALLQLKVLIIIINEIKLLLCFERIGLNGDILIVISYIEECDTKCFNFIYMYIRKYILFNSHLTFSVTLLVIMMVFYVCIIRLLCIVKVIVGLPYYQITF